MSFCALLLCLIMASNAAQKPTQPTAADLMHNALAAMGGEEKIRGLKSIHLTVLGHRNLLEQSERPEGPYIVDYQQTDEWRDLEHGNWKQETHTRDALQDFTQTVIVSDGATVQKFDDQQFPASPEQLQLADDVLSLSPERVLLLALGSADLKRLPDLTLQSVPHQLVQFTHAGTPVRIFLNADTHLPTAVEWVAAYPYGSFLSVWGDVTTRIYYSFWWLQNGIHYPLQADVFRNGLPDTSTAISKIEFNAQIPDGMFTISNEARTAFAARAKITADDQPLGIPSRPAQEPVPGIVIVPGSWNTTIVKQEDGLVILEAPISSGYSAKLLDEARRRFPGVPVKAVVTTSDAWPHFAGVREYVARGIPVYLVDRTQPLLERFLAAPRTIHPDALARSPRKAVFHPVSSRIVIGSGPNRMELYPYRGETSERQMMVYFPAHKLLYGSDPFQYDGKQYFYPQTVSEVVDAVTREHLVVEKFFMMHITVTPWTEALKVVQDAQ